MNVETTHQTTDVFSRRLQEEAAGISAFLRRRLRRPELVSDAVQETMLRAWRGRDTFQEDRRMGPWLLTIAAHVAADLGRGHRESEPWTETTEERNDPAVEAEQNETLLQLKQSMKDLSQTVRDVFDAFYQDGLSVAEISARYGVPANTVKSHLRRARQYLVRSLRESK